MIEHDHAFPAHATTVADRAAAMQDRRHQVGHAVDGLLADWHGEAATAFTAAWLEWQEAADSIIARLTAAAGALSAHHDDVTGVDAHAATSSGRLLGRLG